jgi:hypothetical protein
VYDGSYLDGGITDDATWQYYWHRLIVFPGQMYNLPKGQVGKRFLFALSKILDGVQTGTCNSERFLVFCKIILKRGGVIIGSAQAIRGHPMWRMDACDKGEVKVLVQNTVHGMEAKLSSRQDGKLPER